jgi:hypothetical protein
MSSLKKITVDVLVQQAASTVGSYLTDAINQIDRQGPEISILPTSFALTKRFLGTRLGEVKRRTLKQGGVEG